MLRRFLTKIYLFKVNDKITRESSEICSKLTMKTTKRRSGIFIANSEHISHLFLVFLLLALDKRILAGFTLSSEGC